MTQSQPLPVAIVTGASRGFGKAVTAALLDRGWIAAADGWGEGIFRLEPLIVRPDRYGEPSRFDTMPSQRSMQASS